MDDEHTTHRRVKFDFEVDFSNGGSLQGQDFRLDIEGEEISDEQLSRSFMFRAPFSSLVPSSTQRPAFPCKEWGRTPAGRPLPADMSLVGEVRPTSTLALIAGAHHVLYGDASLGA